MLATLFATVFVVLWSTGFVVARAIAPFADPNLFLLSRFGGAALLFAVAALGARAVWPKGRDLGKHLFAGALLQGVYLGAGYWAVAQGLSAGVMALLGALQPLLTAAVAAPLFGERLAPRGWAGMLLGRRRRVRARTEARRGRSSGAARPCAVMARRSHFDLCGRCDHGRHAVPEDIARQSRSSQRQRRAESRCRADGRRARARAWRASLDSVGNAVGIACGIVMPSGISVTLLVWMVRRGDASRATALLFLAPPLAAIEGHVGFRETLLPVQIVGFAVALIGVLLARS